MVYLIYDFGDCVPGVISVVDAGFHDASCAADGAGDVDCLCYTSVSVEFSWMLCLTYLLILGHLTNNHRIRSTIGKFVCTIFQMLLKNVP